MKTTQISKSNGTPKLRAHAQAQRAKRVPGYLNMNEEGSEAHIWTDFSWCAGICLQRNDMSEADFRALAEQVAAMAFKNAKGRVAK